LSKTFKSQQPKECFRTTKILEVSYACYDKNLYVLSASRLTLTFSCLSVCLFVCLSVFSFFAFTELRTSMAGKVLPHGKYTQKCFSGVYFPTGVWPNLYKHSARTKTNNWPRMLFPTNQFVQMAQMKHFPCVQVRVASIECCLYSS
jgi:hypothetical protein